MSSLFSKIKTLVGAKARGPRRREPVPREQESSPPADVVEAPTRRQKLPEVTEAAIPPALTSQTGERAALSPRPTQLAVDAPPPEALEDGRVADLLKRQNEDERASD